MTPKSFSDLPSELLMVIITYLELPDIVHMQVTCRRFATLIPEQTLDLAGLVASEDSAWALKRRRLACIFCARLRRASAFTDKQKMKKPKSRCCIECQDAYFQMNGGFGGRGDDDYPLNRGRTRLRSEYRKLNIDGLEKGICQSCHNCFDRWGCSNAGRGICKECFLDHNRESRMAEANRLAHDLRHIGQQGYGNWASDEFDGEDFDAIRDNREFEWCYWYWWDWVLDDEEEFGS
ncbi:hypothetical protein BGZ63DRAFT_406301 [Mariannaea sp. PMI_226]|nr:hypothetical protein BGZ63DRAFT_406301 [Mariannaea sp. PMI_226]